MYFDKIKFRQYRIPIIMLLLLLIYAGCSHDQPEPPSLYIDKGACPFECCVYRKWKAEKDTLLRARPEKGSKKGGLVQSGVWVQALTGEVHVLPAKLILTKDYNKFEKGETLWIYTDLIRVQNL